MNSKSGFTIVELVVIIVVLGMLITLGTFMYGDWRARLARDEVVNGLKQLDSAMSNAKNFENVYPAAFPESFTKDDGGTTTTVGKVIFRLVTSADGKSFCALAQNTARMQVSYYLNPPSVATPTTTKPGSTECSSLNPA